MKKIIISESQYKQLIETKKNEKVANKIIEEVEKYKKYLNPNISINEAVKDVLKKYYKKGLVNNQVKSKLNEFFQK